MRSSTSSSKPPERRGPRLDRRVLLLVFAALLVVELGVRVIEPRLSLDIRHIQAIPDIVSDVHESAGPSVVFFGNSLTRAGVDLGVMASGLAPAGVERGGVAAVYPDDTTILDWIYVYEHYLARPDLEPDLLVLGFAVWHLQDADVQATQTLRLGRHFTSWASLGTLFSQDVHRSEERLNVILAKTSRAFANRERISRRVLAALPGYQASAARINDVLRRAEETDETDETVEPTYRQVERFLRSAAAGGTRVVVVAMPTRTRYDLDPRLPDVVEENGAVFVDARDVPGLEPARFRDALHLDEAGAAIYSAYVAPLLLEAWDRMP